MTCRSLLVISLSALSTAACTTVEVQYRSPGGFDDPSAAANAKAGMSFYSLQTIYVDVAPKAASPSEDPPKVKVKPAVEADHAEAAPVAKPAAVTGKQKTPTAAKPAGQKPAAEASADAKPAGDKPAPAPVATGQPSGPATSLIIDGQEIQVTLRPVPDPNHGFLMGGTSGFWRKTTISGTKYADSDRVASVSVKAENLVAKRIGQLASVAGYFLKPGGGTAEAARVIPPLKPFSFEVTTETNDKFVPLKDSPPWEYRLSFEPQPSGAVSWEKFNELHAGRKVNYFPVPACLAATLDLRTTGADPLSYTFKSFVVSTPEIVRLEPLPIDGKLTLAPVCSGSVEGTTTTDRYDEIFGAAEALNKAYTDLSKKPEKKDVAPGEKPATETPAPSTQE